jgi:hypothetical protein
MSASTDNIEAWVKDDTSLAAYGLGSCNHTLDTGMYASATDSTKRKMTSWYDSDNTTLSLGYGMDYAVCGSNIRGRESGGSRQCAFLTFDEFNNIFDETIRTGGGGASIHKGCYSNNNPLNEAECVNMVRDGQLTTGRAPAGGFTTDGMREFSRVGRCASIDDDDYLFYIGKPTDGKYSDGDPVFCDTETRDTGSFWIGSWFDDEGKWAGGHGKNNIMGDRTAKATKGDFTGSGTNKAIAYPQHSTDPDLNSFNIATMLKTGMPYDIALEKVMPPAIPSNIPKIIEADGMEEFYSSNDILEEGDCPSHSTLNVYPTWDSFGCAGHGKDDNSSCPIWGVNVEGCESTEGQPSCGIGENRLSAGRSTTKQLNGNWRFCKRRDDDWDIDNILDCCIGDQGTEWEKGRNNCPSKYCVTKVEYDEADQAESCTPIIDGDSMYCFQMSNECQKRFDPNEGGVCKAEVFTEYPTNTAERKKRKHCLKWAEIFPTKFSELASDICSAERILNESDYDDFASLAINNPEGLTEIIALFESSLCRNHIIENMSSFGQILQSLCGLGVTVIKDGEGENATWTKTPNYERMKNICPCYLPDEYYTWWKDQNLFDGEERSNLEQISDLRPTCYHQDCIRSLLYDPETATSYCPNVEVCIQEINSNIQRLDDHLSSLRTPEDISNIQVCNFSSINGTQDNSGVTVGGATVEGEEAAQYLGAINDLVNSEISDMSNHFPSSSSNTDSFFNSDNLMVIGGLLIFIIVIIVIIVLLTSGSKQQMMSVPQQMMGLR